MSKQAIFEGRKQILLLLRGDQKPGEIGTYLPLELVFFVQIINFYLVTQSL
jgi:hypothetical protein